ncbi:alpha/beta hydrolase [Rothia sp. LK2588]|uniref:alpha/beta fold hydrolase n=1 Tax=Rothia sp. LK2588 TaxID=3114369 RepID=UPI0034CD39C0
MITHDMGEGTPLVMIHGFAVDSRIMLALEDTVDFTGWRRIYVDLPWTEPGHDESLASAQAVLEKLSEELKDLLGNTPFAVVGNSFGGMLARSIAHSFGDQVLGLATIAGVFEPDESARRVPEKRVILRDEKVLEEAGEHAEDFEDLAVIHTPQALHGYMERVFPAGQEADKKVMKAISESYSLDHHPEAEAEQPYDLPSLHLMGRQDHVLGFKDTLAWIDHYTRGSFVVLDGVGHNLHLEKPELISTHLQDWLGALRQHHDL